MKQRWRPASPEVIPSRLHSLYEGKTAELIVCFDTLDLICSAPGLFEPHYVYNREVLGKGNRHGNHP